MTTPRKPLRLWPGVFLASVLVLARYVIPPVTPPDAELFSLPLAIVGVFAGLISAAGIVLWWLLFSRAPWLERVSAVVLMIAAVAALGPLVDKSIRGGMMGNMLFVYSLPILALALVAWAVATRGLSSTGARLGSLVAAIVLASVPFTLIRTAGVLGTGAELHWRWTPTPEDRLLADANDEPKAPPPSSPPAQRSPEPSPAPTGLPRATTDPPAAKTADVPRQSIPGTPIAAAESGRAEAAPGATAAPAARAAVVVSPAEWPGFRGPQRDGIVRDVRINTDWSTSPPVRIWRRPIGPGWSSFAVRGDLLYTQEQRGEEEIVSSYRVSTGEPVWRHSDRVRFWESNAGPGPRGTPTIDRARVYALGATGILNALDAATGKVVWSRNAAADTNRPVPEWGFASSPLVVGETVIVALSGTLAAYEIDSGKLRWIGPRHGGSYSSPHWTTIDGVPQILLLSGAGTTSVSPTNGRLLWEYAWPGVAIVQPALTPDGDVVVNSIVATGGLGTRRLAVSRGPGGWNVEERWTSRGLKPYFNDFVIHDGHAYGFDGSILACISLEDGARKWKGGRYGSGQLVLLPEQDLLLVVSEEGELALVRATTDGYTELARMPALEGKTWNHPAIVRDVLLLRNGEEMTAFRLPIARR